MNNVLANQLENLKIISGNNFITEESFSLLQQYMELLLKWNKKINLVSKKITYDELWQRHILDSAQIIKYIPKNCKKIVDLGSGGGLPAIIIAIIGNYNISVIESDQRKCAFMREASSRFNLNIEIINSRIEDASIFDVDVITSRALAPLTKLFEYSYPFNKKNNYMLFLKGQNVLEEIKEASISWDFKHKIFPDALNKEGGVVEICGLRRR